MNEQIFTEKELDELELAWHYCANEMCQYGAYTDDWVKAYLNDSWESMSIQEEKKELALEWMLNTWKNPPRLVFMNASIMTKPGVYFMKPISKDGVLKYMKKIKYARLSAIGHQAAADEFSKLTGENIEMNRINYEARESDIMIVLKLKQRAQEGRVLTADQMNEVGYDLFEVTFSEK